MDRTLRRGIVVEAVVLVAAVALSIVYFANGLFRVNRGLDVALIAVWVLAAAALLFVLWWRSLVRAELARRIFVGKTGVYSFELGFTPVQQVSERGLASELATFIAGQVSKLSYGYDVADAPADFEPYLLVSSTSFAAHPVDGAPVVDRWKGTVQRIEVNAQGNRTYVDMGSFQDRAQLVELLKEVSPFA